MPQVHASARHWLQRLGSLLPRFSRGAASARSGRFLRPLRSDATAQHPTVGLTPQRTLALLHAADAGQPGSLYELFSEMLQRWPRLSAVEHTRRLALTGLQWQIEPARTALSAASAGPDPLEVAAYCRDTLKSLPNFRNTLDFLASAIGHGVGVAELVWEEGRLVDLVAAPYGRLFASTDEPWRLRLKTEESATVGIALDEQPAKWLVHQPRTTPARPFAGGLLRASLMLYLAQNLSFKDWLIYSQIAGMPLRVAHFDQTASEEEQQKLLTLLKSLGTDAVAALSKNVDLKIVAAPRINDRLYQRLQEHCNTEVTILWLGQHLTTDIRQSGSRAAAEIHDRVREDLLIDDIADEALTIERDLLTPIVQARFGAGVPTPHFRRALSQAVDTRVLADTLATAVGKIGLRVPRSWAHAALGIPEARGGEAVIEKGVTA
ncbi:MAG: DUF935 family protein [Phycisphaerae bacterium]|nr:DUF935 family protein [Phycisphaerae bacterium]